MSAKLNATGFWLTYSQSALTKTQVMDFLKSKGSLKRACVCQEHHQDGGLHIHALVEFLRKKNVAPTHFDIDAQHPNVKVWDRQVQYERWLVNHWKYCFKEDPEPLTEGDEPLENERKRSRDDAVRECIEVARQEGIVAAQAKAIELIAESYCKSANSYDKVFMREANAAPSIPARPLSDFPNAPAVPENWQNLFIWGETGTGKTQFARALLPQAKVVRHPSQLADCRFSDGVIFDDFSVSRWPPTSVIALLDWDEASGINIKYGCIVIPPHTRKIFTFNEDLETWARRRPSQYDKGDEMSDRQFDAVRGRMQLVYHVARPLYEGANRRPPAHAREIRDSSGGRIYERGGRHYDEADNEVFGFSS